MVERHSESSAKVPVAKTRFFLHWLKQTEEERKAALKDERVYTETVREVSALGCPTKKEDLEKIAEEFKSKTATNQLEGANEYIKLRMKVLPKGGEKFEDIAITALANDAKKLNKASVCENLLRRIVKSGSSGEAFKGKAKTIFKLAPAFQ